VSAATPVERLAARGLPATGGAPWAARRRRALETLRLRGLPDRRDENWKYLDHARIAAHAFGEEPGAPAARADISERLLPVAGATRVVLVDGRFDPALSGPVPDGLEVRDLADVVEREPEGALACLRLPAEDADDRWALLADAFAAGGVLIRVAPQARLAAPLYVVHAASATRDAVHQSRVSIDVAAGAQATVIEDFIAAGTAPVLGNLAGDAVLGEGASLTHLRLHREAPTAAQVETWTARLAARANYAQHLLALGGSLLRSNLAVTLEGAGSGCRLDGLFLADGERQVDLVTRIEHAGRATVTRQECRGIAAGRGRGAFNGRIVVRPTARGADASQSSRNLLLAPLAEINARPQLEIEVDDVQCRHGATTGTLDPDQLFYLESRGIDAQAARALLTYAFCRDLIGRVPVAEVRAEALALVAGALPDRDLVRGLD
jgi:Fe-S cluster assembly protein SufD